MSETNGHAGYVPKASISYTPCSLFLELYLNEPGGEGFGSAGLDRDFLWPGSPSKGQVFIQNEMPWYGCGPFKIREMAVDGDEEDGPLLHVTLQTADLYQMYLANCRVAQRSGGTIKPPQKPDKADFLDIVRHFLDSGWHLSHPARWHSKAVGDTGESEQFPEEYFVGDEDDEEEAEGQG